MTVTAKQTGKVKLVHNMCIIINPRHNEYNRRQPDEHAANKSMVGSEILTCSAVSQWANHDHTFYNNDVRHREEEYNFSQ